MEGTELAFRLKQTVRGPVYANEPMWRHTSFRIGGPADALVVPQDKDDLASLVCLCQDLQVPFHVIGAGTNLLVKDEGVRGVVVKVAGTLSEGVRSGSSNLRSGAGALLPVVCRKAASWGLAGLEFASGIPGAVGGALAMNAAAFGSCISQPVSWAEAVTYDGRCVRLDRESLRPGVKTTSVLAEPLILVEVEFALTPDDPEAIHARMEECLRRRSCRQPLSQPSAGCAFKNPTNEGAGRFIDAAGLKGTRIGGAEISRVHANFIVNAGGATAEDVISLMEKVQEVVHSQFGVVLEPEIRILGG